MAQDVTIEVLEVSVTISPEEQARTFALQAETAKTGAETAESGAVTAKNQSETARDQAVTAKNAAENAETGAETARDKAEEWAESATPPEAGSKSSKTWAGESANSASEAETSAIDAGNEKDAAEGFKDLSQAWAESATAPDGAGTKSSKTYASESEAARDASVVAQGQSETAKDAAVVAQGNAETARDEAVTAKNAAELAETGAETAEGNAVTAKNESETARDLSQAWAESATEPDGAGTKSSKTWAGEAEQSATDAEAAKDAVEAITDFTDGNVYQGDGTGIDSLSREDFGKQIEVFEKSFVYAALGANTITDWDNFTRANGALGNTEGKDEAWSQYSESATTNPIEVLTNSARFRGAETANTPSFAYLNSHMNDKSKQVTVSRTNTTADYQGLAFFKDANNWVWVAINQQSILVKKKISGVETTIFSQSILFSQRYRATALEINASIFSNGADSALVLNFIIPQLGVNEVLDLSTDYATLNTNAPAFYVENKFGGRVNSFLYKDLTA